MTPIEIGRSQNQIPIKDIFAANCSLQQNETISFTLLKQVHTTNPIAYSNLPLKGRVPGTREQFKVPWKNQNL